MKRYNITIDFEVPADNETEAFLMAQQRVSRFSNRFYMEIEDIRSYRIKELENQAKKDYADACNDDAGWGVIQDMMNDDVHEYLVLQGKPHDDCEDCDEMQTQLEKDGVI